MLSRTASKRLQARVPTRASEPQGPCPLRLPEVPGLRHLRSSNQWFLRQFSVSENDPQERSRRTRECRRSEEHTSELQSLMRISYAVFCLKKKNTQYTTQTQSHRPLTTTIRHVQHQNPLQTPL